MLRFALQAAAEPTAVGLGLGAGAGARPATAPAPPPSEPLKYSQRPMATWTVEEVRVTPTRCASHHHWPGWFSIMPPLLPARRKSLLVASIKTERLTADWARVQVGEWLDETVGLPQHAEAFKTHTIDGFLLRYAPATLSDSQPLWPARQTDLKQLSLGTQSRHPSLPAANAACGAVRAQPAGEGRLG